MFLHKLDILNRNLNGLFKKFLLVVTKLCAVTKLGDLTVLTHKNSDSPYQQYGESVTPHITDTRSRRLPVSLIRGVVFQIGISPRIRSQNRTVRDPCQTDLCKNVGKTSSLPCLFNIESGRFASKIIFFISNVFASIRKIIFLLSNVFALLRK